MELKIIKWPLCIILLLACTVNCMEIEQGLPMLEQQLIPDALKQYQVEQRQSFLLQCSPQSQIIGKLYHQCHIHDPYIDIQNLMQIDYKNSQRKKYLYSSKYAAIYILDDSEFIAHSIGDHKQKDKQVFKFDSNCSKAMQFQYGKQKIFIFSCDGIYEVTLGGDSFKMKQSGRYQEIMDIYSAQRYQDLIVLITVTKGVNIYAIDVNLNVVLLQKIQLDEQSEIVDSFYSNNTLTLLDKNKGLLLYKRTNKNKFVYYDNLSFDLDEEIQYSSIINWKKSIFIAIDAQTQSFVVQLQTINKKVYLVRYYKGYDQIIKMQILNNTLIIHSNSKIDVFPINRDPRIINQLLNGYSYSHDQSVLSFEHLQGDRFLLLRSRSSTVTRWNLVGKKIECEFQQTGMFKIMLQQPCQPNIEESFRQTCSQVSISTIKVYHKDTYIWLLFIIIGFFITAVLLLIYWRQAKVARIVHILAQIKNFQLKKKEIQFKEVNYQHQSENEGGGPKQLKQLRGQEKEQQSEEMDPYEQYVQSQRNNLN